MKMLLALNVLIIIIDMACYAVSSYVTIDVQLGRIYISIVDGASVGAAINTGPATPAKRSIIEINKFDSNYWDTCRFIVATGPTSTMIMIPRYAMSFMLYIIAAILFYLWRMGSRRS